MSRRSHVSSSRRAWARPVRRVGCSSERSKLRSHRLTLGVGEHTHLLDVRVAVDYIHHDVSNRFIVGVHGDPAPPGPFVAREVFERERIVIRNAA